MPEDPLKKLLVRLKLDTSDFSKTIQTIKSQMKEINESAKKDAIAATAEAKKHSVIIKEQILDQQRLQAEARTLLAVDQAKAQWEKKNQEVIRTKIQQRVLETTEAKKQQTIAQGNLKLEQQQLQLQQQRLRLMQQQTVMQQRQNQAAGGGGLVGGLGKLASGIAGGGLLGAVFSGSLLAGGAIELIEKMGEKIHELGTAILAASGPTQQLRMEFERLAQLKGQDPSVMLEKLRVATRGLVADVDLFKIANNFLKSGMNVTTDQVIKLTENTINLGRSMGKTGQDVARALELAFLNPQRGMMILARTTGIQVQELRRSIQGLPQSIDPAIRATIMFNSIMEQEERMLRKVGVPITTLPELLTQAHNAETNFVAGMAEGLLKTGTFGKTINDISKYLIEIGPKLQEAAEWIGEKLGGAFVVAGEAGKLFYAQLRLLVIDLYGVLKVFFALNSSVFTTGEDFKIGGKKVDGFRGAMGSLALVINQVGFAFNRTAILSKLFFDTLSDVGKGTEAVQKDFDHAASSMSKLNREHKSAQQDIVDYITGKKLPAPGAVNEGKHPDDDTIATRNKIADAELKLQKLNHKLAVDALKNRIEQEQALLRGEYDAGILALSDYVGKQKVLKNIAFQASLEELRADEKAQEQNIKTKSKVEIDGKDYDVMNAKQKALALAALHTSTLDKETTLTTQHNRDIDTLNEQVSKDRIAAYNAMQEGIAKLALEGVAERRKILESEFKEGLTGSDSYLAARRTLIQEELDATLAGLKIRAEAAKNDETEKAKIIIAEAEAHRKADNEIIDLDTHKDDIVLQSLKTHYDKARQYLNLEATISKGGTATESQDQFAINSMLMKMTNDYIIKLQEQRAPLQAGSTLWTDITEQIAQATEEQKKLNLELLQSKDIAAPLAGMFGGLAGVLGQFKTTGAKMTGQLFTDIQGSMEKLSQFSMFIGQQRSGKPMDQEEVRRNATAIFNRGLESSTSLLNMQSKAIANSIIALGTFEEALTGRPAHTPTPPRFSFASGGVVPGAGPIDITAHGGETIVPTGEMQKFVSALKSAVDALQQLVVKAKTSLAPPAPSTPGAPPDTSKSIAPSDTPSATDSLQQPFKNLGTAFENLFKSTSKASDGTSAFGSKLHDFAGQVSNWISGVEGTIKGVTSGKTAAGGALSGGLAGAKMGSVAGPWGMAIGAAAGAITGGLIGRKEEQLEETMHKIQDSMQSIITSMNEGAITLSTAIQDMRNERQAAIQMLAKDPKASKGGGKKGSSFNPSQGQAIIDQIDSQIAQLVNTQQQLLSQLDQQVAILSNPLPFQQYAQSLDSIIEKYQQFASAAGGSSQAVANSQLFLNESLQAYVTTLGQQLNQAQQSAIQDALTLLNLEYQRQQIINQEAQQEYDILTQGVLSRQRTTAMTKGQQIGQLQYQANMQLQQIDEQIALQQYKVQTEQQIFNLATTRIGLETQLLTLQEQAAGTQNEQTAALLQVVTQLQAGMSNGSLMSSISNLGSTPTGTGVLTTLLGTLGLGGNVPTSVLTGTGGATNYLDQVPQQYQSITNFINNLDPNFLQNLWTAMQTPAGSSQRQSVLAEGQQYSQDANTSGYDWTDFAAWIQSGSSIQGSTATISNSPVPTGPSGLPGEQHLLHPLHLVQPLVQFPDILEVPKRLMVLYPVTYRV